MLGGRGDRLLCLLPSLGASPFPPRRRECTLSPEGGFHVWSLRVEHGFSVVGRRNYGAGRIADLPFDHFHERRRSTLSRFSPVEPGEGAAGGSDAAGAADTVYGHPGCDFGAAVGGDSRSLGVPAVRKSLLLTMWDRRFRLLLT